MKVYVAALLVAFIATMPVRADISVSVDTSFAKKTLGIVCSSQPVNEHEVRQSVHVQNMVKHFAQFRSFFTMDAYVDALQKASACTLNERDIFRFNDVIENKALLDAEMKWIEQNGASYSGEIKALLEPYAPAEVAYDGAAIIMIGTPSCGGWSKQMTFYVDLPCITGDPKGLQYLIAHESYHGIQDQFMPEYADVNYMAQLFDQTIREGSATAFADFTEIEGGKYTKLNQDVARTNKRRMESNFALLEMAVVQLRQNPSGETFDAINNIGFSGSFDSPLYWVGYTIVNAVEKAKGAPALTCLLQQGPHAVFQAYANLTHDDKNMPSLGAQTINAVDAMKGDKANNDC